MFLINVINYKCLFHSGTAKKLPCFGKNVIVSGEAFGKNKGFTYDPTSKEKYINLLDELPFKKELDKEIVSLAQILM